MADQHQSLSRERPLRPVPSSPVRSVSVWSPKTLLILSASQTDVDELSQAFSCQQLAFRQEFASELLPPQSGALPFEDFSILLDEITRGSFRLIAIPPTSTWSRARNSGIPFTLNHLWEYKVCLQSCWTKCENTQKHLSSVSWLWTCGAGVSRRALSSVLGRKTEEDRHSTGRLRIGSLQR